MVDPFEARAKSRNDPFERRAQQLQEKSHPQEPVSLKGAASAYGSGAAGGAGGLIPDVAKLLEPLSSVSPGIGALKNLMSASGAKTTPELTESIAEGFGSEGPQNSLERILQTSGEFGGQEAILGTALGGPAAGGLGLAHGSASGALYGGLKELGMDDKWALGVTAVASVSPIALQKLISKFKARVPLEKAFKDVAKEIPEAREAINLAKEEMGTFPSGLTKSKAVDNPHASKGILTPERQKKAIKSIDEETSRLAKKVVEKHVPAAKKIEEGFDFEARFDAGFGTLQKAAKAANPDIDITDIGEFLGNTRKKMGSLPPELFTDEQKKILKEVSVLRNKPQTKLKNLLDLFRLNNKKITKIYERRLLEGSQADYVDFLMDLNRSIVKSVERTLPEDSVWLNQFKKLNKDFSGFKKAEKTLNMLEALLKGNINSNLLNKLSVNPKMQKKLSIAMGEEGAKEIIQLAKDAKQARESIKGIPAKKIKEMDAIYPLGLVIPGLKIAAAVPMVRKGAEYLRRAYGWYLTTPARTSALDAAVKAVSKGDVEAYRKATTSLKE